MTAAAACGLLASRSASAAVLVWDPAGTGSGYDATGAWTTDPQSPPSFDSPTNFLVVWDNTANAADTASFGVGGTGSYSVNLGTSITAGGILFNTGNYTINPVSGGLTLTTGTGLTVADGTSAVGNVAAPITVSNDQTWSVGTLGTLNVSNTVSGSVALTKTGAGTLSLTGTTGFTSFTLAGGTLSAGNATVLNGSPVTFTAASTFRDNGAFNQSSNITVNTGVAASLAGTTFGSGFIGTIGGAGSVTTTGTLSLTGANTFTGGLTVGSYTGINGDTALGTAGGAVTINGSGTLSNYIGGIGGVSYAPNVVVARNLTLGGAARYDGSYSISGVISGTGSFSAYGTSGTRLNLTGSNTYSGGTGVTIGTVAFTNGSAFGTGTITAGTAANNGAGSISSSATPFLLYNGSSTAVTVPNNIALPAPTTAAVYTLSQNGGIGSVVTFSGVISGGSAATTLELNSQTGSDAASTYAFNGSNTLAGTIYLNRGSLAIGNSAALGTTSLTMDSYTSTVLSFTAPVTLPNAISDVTAFSINTATNAVTLSGVVSGTKGLTLIGTGSKLTLSGTNTFSGGLNISAGSVVIGTAGGTTVNQAGLGTGPLTVSTGAASNTSVGSSNTAFLTVAQTGAANVSNGIALPTSSAAGTVYTLQKNAVNSSSGTQLDLTGAITGGNANLTLELNSGTSSDSTTSFRFDGTNSFLGTVVLNRGAIVLGNASAAGASTNQIVLRSNANATTGNLVFGFSGTLPNPIGLADNGFGPTTYPISTNGNNVTLTGVVSTITGSSTPPAFTKLGAGTLTLAAPETYTTATNVNAGTLAVTGSTNSSSAVTVNTGGVLAGTGTIGGTVRVASGATITGGTGSTPSDSAGNLSTGAQTWNASGAYVAKYDATNTIDRLILSSLTVQSGFVVNVQAASGGSLPIGTYILAADTGATAGTDPFGTGSANGVSTGVAAKLTLAENGGTAFASTYSVQSVNDSLGIGGVDLALTVVAAPEPTSLLLASLAVAPLLGRRRRRLATAV